MDQRTSLTRRSCRQYWNNLPAHRKKEILSRGEWTTFTLLINLPPTSRRGGRHHLSDNKGDNKADNADVGEDSVSDDADDAINTNKEDHSQVTQPPSDNDDDHDHSDDEDDNEDEDDDDDSYNSYNQGDIAIYDSDNHLIIDDFHPYDEVDEEDKDDEDSNIDEDDNKDSDIDKDDDNEDKDKDKDDDKDEDNQDVDEDEDIFLISDKIYSASTVSFRVLNHKDDHSSLSSIEEDHSDHSSVSSIDFDRFDFAPILADLELIRQNGYMRNPRTKSYHSVNSSWRFTESQIRAAVGKIPDSFLREYFVGGTFPNFH